MIFPNIKTRFNLFYRTAVSSPLDRFLAILFAIRLVCALIGCFAALPTPHVWRQIDTLGVSFRYWLKLTEEPWSWSFFLPAVLNSGMTSGIMPMEFPILNLLSSPLFFFGPEWGTAFARLFALFLLTTLVFANIKVWRGVQISGIKARHALLLTPVFSFCGPFTSHFMPDAISMFLCLMAVGFLWKGEGKQGLACAFVATLGLLMKPTSVIVFFLLLLSNEFLKMIKKKRIVYLWPILAALAVSGWYYVFANPWIASYEHTDGLFATKFRPLRDSLFDFLTHPARLYDILNFYVFFPNGLIIFALLLLFFLRQKKSFSGIYLVLLGSVQILTIGALDGEHTFIHSYYFIGAAPTFSFLGLLYWQQLTQEPETIKKKSWIRRLLAICVIAFFIGAQWDPIYADLKGLKEPSYSERKIPFSDCAALLKRNPDLPWRENFVFQTSNEVYPALGLCFGVRTNSRENQYGLFYLKDVPKTCKTIDSSGNISITLCQKIREL